MASENPKTRTISLRIPLRLKGRMEEYDWVNWSKIVRVLLTQKLDELDRVYKQEQT